MEWVETTAKTVDEAKDLALDRLGVDEHDAEFEVLDEPRPGLFGRTRGEARVRARVRPVQPRPKADRRDRRRGRGPKGRERNGGRDAPTDRTDDADDADDDIESDTQAEVGATADAGSGDGGGVRRGRGRERNGGRRGGRTNGRTDGAAASSTDTSPTGQEDSMSEDVTVEQQGEMVEEFLSGLVEAFGLDADVTTTRVDDDTVEVAAEGSDLGLLVGPKGATLQAIHDLSRTVVQRRATGNHEGRVRIDVAGYREKRRAALERFTQKIAAEVIDSGTARVLEPMSPADRKVVHDAANEIDGVRTTSEGDEPRRRVVVLPADD